MEWFEAQEILDELAEELDNRHGVNDSDDLPEDDDLLPFVETLEVVKVDRCEGCGFLSSVCRCHLTLSQRRARLVRELG